MRESITNDGRPAVEYNLLAEVLLERALRVHQHEGPCTAECEPPTERSLIEFLERLSEDDRTRVDFLLFAYKRGLRLERSMWQTTPLELL